MNHSYIKKDLSKADKSFFSIMCGTSYSSTAFTYSSSSFASRSSTLFSGSQYGHHHQNHHHRSASPPRVNFCGSGATPTHSAPSVRMSLDRPISPNRSISSVSRPHQVVRKPAKKTCMCSPTTHPGSFRCSLCKNFNSNNNKVHRDLF